MEEKLIKPELSLIGAGSEVLAAQVIAYRALGINKKLAMICMAELSRRRIELGEEFDFESYIESEIKKIPEIPKMDLIKLGQTVHSMKPNK